jgi:hypothetical protein
LLLGTILCAKDKLFLTDKIGDSKIPVCGFLPNPNPFSETVTLKGGDVSFHFTTDASESRSGFEVTYQLIDKSPVRGKYMQSAVNSTRGGNGYFSRPGTISSPPSLTESNRMFHRVPTMSGPPVGMSITNNLVKL